MTSTEATELAQASGVEQAEAEARRADLKRQVDVEDAKPARWQAPPVATVDSEGRGEATTDDVEAPPLRRRLSLLLQEVAGDEDALRARVFALLQELDVNTDDERAQQERSGRLGSLMNDTLPVYPMSPRRSSPMNRAQSEADVIGKPSRGKSGEDLYGGTDLNEVKVAETSSDRRAFANAVICFVGSGVLGLPFAFEHVGVVGGILGLVLITVISLHCMFIMVDAKLFLEEKCGKHIKTYGDIGFYAFGRTGSLAVDLCIILTQTGFCIAYLIFIAKCMHEVVDVPKRVWILLCLPLLIPTSWFRSLKPLAPFSLLAEVSISVALMMVLVFDLSQIFSSDVPDKTVAKHLDIHNDSAVDSVIKIMDFKGIPYFFGVCVYCFEGIGMVLPVYNSMSKPERFKVVWGSACTSVAMLYIIFGLLGYCAFRGGVSEVITTNLPSHATTKMMKIALCIGLLFTYPIMCMPVFELMEDFVGVNSDATDRDKLSRNTLRLCFVVFTGMTAMMVPRFGVFISLVGATASAALAFVLPALFHLKLRYSLMTRPQCCREFLCIVFGTVGGILGTMSAVNEMRESFGE